MCTLEQRASKLSLSQAGRQFDATRTTTLSTRALPMAAAISKALFVPPFCFCSNPSGALLAFETLFMRDPQEALKSSNILVQQWHALLVHGIVHCKWPGFKYWFHSERFWLGWKHVEDLLGNEWMSEVSFGLCLFAFLLYSLDVTDKRYWCKRCKQKKDALWHPNIHRYGMVLLQCNINWTFKKHNQDLLFECITLLGILSVKFWVTQLSMSCHIWCV